MRTKNLLLIIDMQNDFCLPGGALYVDGAEKDVARLSRFISTNEQYIDKIILTRDTHHVIDISHPAFWENENGENPSPFTPISLADIESQKWRPKFFVREAKKYLEDLDKQREFGHVIWPEHCINGSSGAAIADELMVAVGHWARKGNYFEVVQKGLNPLSEHFGAIRANIPVPDDVQTLPNPQLIRELKTYDNIIIAGEAKSHCVANTIKQILEAGAIKGQLIILDDAMSNVTGFENLATPIYSNALKKGAIISVTDKLQLK
jgi:nicotinamidase/pyrazinamidase